MNELMNAVAFFANDVTPP